MYFVFPLTVDGLLPPLSKINLTISFLQVFLKVPITTMVNPLKMSFYDTFYNGFSIFYIANLLRPVFANMINQFQE